MAGHGPDLAFPTFSDGAGGVAPSADDCNRWSGNQKFFAMPPSLSVLRYDTALVSDNSPHICRFDTLQWDIDSDGGIMAPDLQTGGSGMASTFNINTTGLYDIKARERFSASDTGYMELWVEIVGGSVLDLDHVPFVAENIYTAELNRRVYLTAGQQIQFYHKSFSGQDLVLYQDNPRPFAEINYAILRTEP